MNSNSVIRIRILLVLVCTWALVLVVRLYQIQIVKSTLILFLASSLDVWAINMTLLYQNKFKIEVL